jgi:hypothetical protein
MEINVKDKNETELHSRCDDRAGKKRAYTPPGIIYREPLEAAAAACVPTPPGKAEGQCGSPSS